MFKLYSTPVGALLLVDSALTTALILEAWAMAVICGIESHTHLSVGCGAELKISDLQGGALPQLPQLGDEEAEFKDR